MLVCVLYLCWSVYDKCFMYVPKMFCISLMYKNFHVLLLSYKYFKSGTNGDC